jgi:D-alanine-D-alanine ligase
LRKNVLVIFGGVSEEHEVSLSSATNVIKNIPREKYNIITLGITKEGKWMLYKGPIRDIKNGDWKRNKGNVMAFISPDRRKKGLIVLDEKEILFQSIDVVFPVLHGKNGEDGSIQGLLELSGIPYVGCKVASSANCMDKVITDSILKSVGIKKANSFWFHISEFNNDQYDVVKRIEEKLGPYPYFVKPANSGSSVGISKVSNREKLKEGITFAANEDNKILVEECIKGQELECAVLGNQFPIASIIGEISSPDNFYDYNSKYINDTSTLYIPARISDEISDQIRNIAIKAFKTMGCQGLSRIDFFLREGDNEIILNEINTMPGFTNISMYPKLVENMGISVGELLDRLLVLAIGRKTL